MLKICGKLPWQKDYYIVKLFWFIRSLASSKAPTWDWTLSSLEIVRNGQKNNLETEMN